MAGATLIAAGLVAARLIPALLMVAPFVASSLARRLHTTAAAATIDDEGLWLGDRLAVARADVVDAWFDPDDRDVRVTVAAKPDRMIVLHLANAPQARSFVGALLPEDHSHRVAGTRPRVLDLLYPLRFLAIAGAWAVTAQPSSAALIAAFFLLTGWGVARAVQIDAGPEAIELRGLLGTERIACGEVEEVDEETATLRLEGGRERRIPSGSVRDPLFVSEAWVRRAHARVLEHARAIVVRRRATRRI